MTQATTDQEPRLGAGAPRRSGRSSHATSTRLIVAAIGLAGVGTGLGADRLLEDPLLDAIAAGVVALVLVALLQAMGIRCRG